MGQIFDFLINRPFSWLLLRLYDFTHSYVFAIVLFAVVVKAVLLYFSAKGKQGTMRTQRLQPKIAQLQKQYGQDRARLNEETMKLYQREGTSPMSGCLWMLLPFPVLIALYNVIREPLTHLMGFTVASDEKTVGLVQRVIDALTNLGVTGLPVANAPYAQLNLAQEVHNNFGALNNIFGGVLHDIDFMFLGANMAQVPKFPWNEMSWMCLIPLVSAGTAYLTFWVSTKMSRMPQTSQTRTMGLISPVISLWFGFTMPAAMSIYWTTNNVLGAVQEYFLTKHFNKVIDAEEAHKADLEERRRIAEEKQKEQDRIERAERIAAQTNRKGKYKVKRKPGK